MTDGNEKLKPIERRVLAGVVAERVREGVVAGTFPPGEQVIEAELTRQLGVSRGAVREGLQRLIQEELLEVRAQGVFVVSLSESDVSEIYVARRAVERAAIQRLIEIGRNTHLPELHDLLSEMASAAAAGEWHRTADLDLRFHEQLVKASQNRRLQRMYSTLLTETRLSLGHHYVGGADNVKSHEHLLTLIEGGDLSEIDEALQEHLGSAIRNFHSS